MTIPEETIYPHTGDQQTVHLKSVITGPSITVGDYKAASRRKHLWREKHEEVS